MIAVAGLWWHRNIIEPGKLPLLLTFSAFVITFVVTRTVTRMIRAGRGTFKDNVSPDGLHIHHAVPGVIALAIGAFVAVGSQSASPWHAAGALLVGVGTSLVLDEFALILRLEDVYWTDEGRTSVEMISVAFACLGCALVGVVPFGVDDMGSQELSVRFGAVVATAITLALVVVCVLKGKLKMALFGTFVPVLAWVGALRLARPRSRWSRRYGPERQSRSVARTAAFDARWSPTLDRLSDVVAGKPSQPGPNINKPST